ncbi:hypothetical protein [Actinomadura rudentiformis]|uniref:Uncharacterized protein n=1 Tax=Actinomadura rudentiformis TaxID=359158 RepID=A0A6H9YNU8_9ACTN|nr:hypothetical protein [Actinomadura rudentiformis]KAB2340632.1 hypothetical protein F8566_44770 [Actinomadura rudentiformis]
MRDGTDLERLRGAFAELNERGFGADFDLAWRAFTKQDAAAETPRGPKGFLYSYAQAYADAFYAEEGWGVAEQPMPDWVKNEIEAMKPELLAAAGIDPDEHAETVEGVERGDYDADELHDDYVALVEEWEKIDDNHARVREALRHERIHRWHTLLRPLVIGWYSPDHLGEIVEVLTSYGLDVTPPPNEKTVIFVNPSPPQPASG